MRSVIALLGFLLVIGGSITAPPMLAASDHGVFVVSDQEAATAATATIR